MVKKNALAKNIALIFGVLVLMVAIVFLVGRSFGFFNYAKKGQVLNVVTINGIEVNVLNNSNNALNLENMYPMYDSEGMELDSFDFSIKNTAGKSLDYTLKVVNDTDKQSECVLDDGLDSPCPELSTDYIRYSYKVNNGEWSTPANLGNNSDIIFSDAITGKETVNVSIKIWIDQNAGNSIQNHYFFGKLIIEGTKSLANKVSVIFDDNMNLVYGLDDTNNVETGFSANWSITNGTLEQTAITDDGYAFNSGRVYLEAGKTYVFNCDTDGEWTEVDVATQFNNINDTVEAFIMKDGNFSKYYRFSSNNNFEFTPDTAGVYHLRFDVNEIDKTYHFWNISIKEKKDYGVKHVTVGQTYGDLPTPTREGYTFKGWHGKNLLDSEIEPGKLGNTDGSIDDTDSTYCVRTKEFISVVGDRTYIVSNNMDYANYVYEYDINKDFIKYYAAKSTPFSFKTTASTAYIKVRTMSGLNQNDINVLFQLEEGTEATPYEPYYITSNTTVVQNQNHTLTAIWEKNN